MKKTAIVTGASSGLGKEVTKLLAKDGYTVFALARTVQETALPETVIKIKLNIRDLQSIDDAFKAIDRQADRIDLLVNCAGRGLVKPLEQTSRDEIMDIFGVNLKGNIYVAQEVYKRMLPHSAGHIVNVGSTTSIRARADEPIYAASKWGLRGFTESLRLAAAAHGIRATGVYPGGMQTGFWDAQHDTSAFMDPEAVAAAIMDVVRTSSSISPSEYVIERGVKAPKTE